MRVIVVEAVGRTTAEMRPRPRADDGNLASDQRSGATPAGEASAESGGADSDRGSGEWGGRSGVPSSNLEVKFLNSRAVRLAGKPGPARQSSQPGNLVLPG